MGVAELFANTAILVAGCMFVLWLLSLVLRDASIADIFWGLGFALIAAATTAWTADGSDSRRALIAAMTIVWGLRLAVYLLWRNAGHGEDPRYRRHAPPLGGRVSPGSASFSGLRAAGRADVDRVAAGAARPAGGARRQRSALLDALGVGALRGGASSSRAVGDWQARALQGPIPANAGRVMDRGLWRYTRHPNYFGDFCVWWGIFLVALGSEGAAWSIAGPLVMSFLLMRVSGVPMLERSIRKRRPAYEQYAKRTSAFFPQPPKPD